MTVFSPETKHISKVKDTGRWTRGTVVHHLGSMATIEFDQGIASVNETKARKDHDAWHDVSFPADLVDPSERNSSRTPAQAAAPRLNK